MQGVPQLQEFLFSCIDGNGRFSLQICMGTLEILMTQLSLDPLTSGVPFKMVSFHKLEKLWEM